MITKFITEHDILGRQYDPRQLLKKDARHEIDKLFSEYDGESLKSHLVDLANLPMMFLREVLLELIEVSVIGLLEKVRSEGWTEENFDTGKHISSLIMMMPIEHERNVVAEAWVQLVKETPTPDEAAEEDQVRVYYWIISSSAMTRVTASVFEAWAKEEFKEK